MRVIVGHGEQADVRTLRQILLGAGLHCGADDCVYYGRLTERLAQSDPDLVLVKVDDPPQLDWRIISEARSMTMAPMLAIGPEDAELMQKAQEFGVSMCIDETNLRHDLDGALEKLAGHNHSPQKRGRVYSIFAPVAGCGASTLAANLAGACAKLSSGDVGLIELTRRGGDLAILLDVEPRHTVHDVCLRWAGLDRVSLQAGFEDHASGIHTLTHGPDDRECKSLSADAVRRIAVLSRLVYDANVLLLDNCLEQLELEALRLSDQVLLVVRPDVLAVRRARFALETMEDAGIARERISLVVNRWGQRGQLDMNRIEETLGLPAAIRVPESVGLVNRAGNVGKLLVQLSPGARICRRLKKLARKLESGEKTSR